MPWVRDSDPGCGTYPYIFDVYRSYPNGASAACVFVMFLRYVLEIPDFDYNLARYWIATAPKKPLRAFANKIHKPEPDWRTRLVLACQAPPGTLVQVHRALSQKFPKLRLSEIGTTPGDVRSALLRCTYKCPAVASVDFPGMSAPHMTLCLGAQDDLIEVDGEIVFLDPTWGVVVSRSRFGHYYDTAVNSFHVPGKRGIIREVFFAEKNPIDKSKPIWGPALDDPMRVEFFDDDETASGTVTVHHEEED